MKVNNKYRKIKYVTKKEEFWYEQSREHCRFVTFECSEFFRGSLLAKRNRKIAGIWKKKISKKLQQLEYVRLRYNLGER